MNNINFKNQQIAFEKFSKLKIGALFMEMGTGKTKVAINLVNYNKVDFLLYIAPFSTLINIQSEISKWNLNCKYCLAGYETISSSDCKYLKLLEMIKANKRSFIIADESIFIKNEKTKRFNRLCELRKYCEYALILNGTPITKNEWDLYNQMYFLSPKIIDMNRNEFRNKFFKKITYKKRNSKEHSFYKFSEINAEYLQRLISPYVFKCSFIFDKEESENFVFIENKDINYLSAYEDTKVKYLKQYAENGNSDAIIALLQRLNYIASINEDKNEAVVEYCENKQVIIFCNFIEEEKHYKEHMDCFYINGSINICERKNIINQFKVNSKPLVITLGTGAYSLNLQFCNEVVYSSITFDFGKIKQSEFRIKRIGQENNIKYSYFLVNSKINNLILNNLKNKKNLNSLIKEKIEKGELEKWAKDI